MILVPLFASILPFLLWPVELLLPYPHIIEELAKAALVWFILKSPSNSPRIQVALICGILFALSESTLYIFNLTLVGTTQTLITRLATTLPMHTLTILIILLSALKTKKLIVLGFLAAVLIHFSYNLAVLNLLK